MKTARSVTLGSISRELAAWERSDLIALVKDLYTSSPENRDFIEARCSLGSRSETLEKYRRKIVDQFFPERGEGKLKLGEARKAIRDYRKATKDIAGTLDLMLCYVESGTEFTQDFGDINERFYDSMESALIDFANLLRKEAPSLYPQFDKRLSRVESMSNMIGWGFGDCVSEIVYQLSEELEEQQPG